MFYFLIAIIGFGGQVEVGGTLVSYGNEYTDSSDKEVSAVVDENFIVIWPEQVQNRLNISLTYSFGDKITVELYNAIGALVLKTDLVNPRTSIDVSLLDRGVYFVSVITEGKRCTTRRVIIY